MQAHHAHIKQKDCQRCKLFPSVRVIPCNHILCYDHYLGGDWRLAQVRCARCGKETSDVVSLEQESTVTPPAHLGDQTWSANTPSDSLGQWPSSDMDKYTNGSGYGRQYYESPTVKLRQLPVRLLTSTDTTAAMRFDGSSDLNPSTPTFEPRAYNGNSIVRPESSISNQSFATQLPGNHAGFGQTYNGPPGLQRPPYLGQSQGPWMQHHSNGHYNNAGALTTRMANVSLNGGAYSRPPYSGNQDFGMGRVDRTSTANSMSSSDCTPKSLAASIMNGDAEDPYDRSLRRLDKPIKAPAPSMGPARFKDTKMFSTTGSNPDIEITATAPVQRPQGPSPPPNWLTHAIQGQYTPTVDEAFDALPFLELGRNSSPSGGGVIRITDIPYQTTRQEMTAFVGRNAQILRQPEGSPYHAVHIFMERETGKTLDCFIELTTPSEAAWVVKQFASRAASKRQPKVGDRAVEVVYSSQDELMSELFPRAKHVRWSGGRPVVDTTPRKYYRGQDAAGFQGFIHSEELVMLEKHANLSERSPFASKSPCRVYESMITTLYKYPWYAVDYITVKERRAVFDCFMALLRALIDRLRRGSYRQDPTDPSAGLLQELAVAALSCPGFSEKQKAAIVARLLQNGYTSMVDGRCINVALGGTHPYSPIWPFAALSFTQGTDNTLIDYYGMLFQSATNIPRVDSLAARKAAEASGGVGTPMGSFTIGYGSNAGDLSLADVAKMEYNKIEELLRGVCRNDAGRIEFCAPGSAALGGGGTSSSDGTHSLF